MSNHGASGLTETLDGASGDLPARVLEVQLDRYLRWLLPTVGTQTESEHSSLQCDHELMLRLTPTPSHPITSTRILARVDHDRHCWLKWSCFEFDSVGCDTSCPVAGCLRVRALVVHCVVVGTFCTCLALLGTPRHDLGHHSYHPLLSIRNSRPVTSHRLLSHLILSRWSPFRHLPRLSDS